ncbi:hypothetical protein MCUN1_001450 [Malassezia cuniculi]|uniref:Peroxisomal membrane protein 4 n=1 Tax=Malassezia cuniculi TaxID=948313 RepID=A0AAF0EU22_9BASI|nr:hypothetical protein MCUN1_001450 [Malassezia cuniculi]
MLSGVKAAVENFVLDPKNQAPLSIIKGARNGLVYGAKIRFPHALVMITLFGSGSMRHRFSRIITATRQHSTRLCLYVALYKALVLAQRMRNGKVDSLEPFVAGMLGGWLMFGELTPVNEQIVLYCVGRIVAALLPRAEVSAHHPPGKAVPIDKGAFQVFAALTWGTIMWLFVHKRERLNRGLVLSMDYLYVLSDKWDSLRNFLWHNV